MNSFTIDPFLGLRGGIQFGMTREEVRRLLAPAQPKAFQRDATEVDAFYGSTLQVNYDQAGRVEFIELARSDHHVSLEGLDVFGVPASEVVARVSARHALHPGKRERGYSFRFPGIELSFWRSVVPESEADEEGRYFESVGFGRAGYYSAPAG